MTGYDLIAGLIFWFAAHMIKFVIGYKCGKLDVYESVGKMKRKLRKIVDVPKPDSIKIN